MVHRASIKNVALFALVVLMAFGLAGSAAAQCPTGVGNMQPANNAQAVPTSGSLSWTVDGGPADYFEVYFGETPANPCGRTTNPDLVTSRGGSSFTIEYADLKPSTSYSYKVIAYKAGCGPIASSCSTFTTGCQTTGPTLINPPNGVTDDHLRVKFVWDPVFGATGYDVKVKVNGGPEQTVGSTTDVNATSVESTIAAGQHAWWVEARVGSSCPPAKSETWTFGTSCPTAKSNPLAPGAGTTLSSPQNIRFEWTSVGGADGYDVVVVQGTQQTTVASTREAGGILAATNATVAALPGTGTGAYSWFVRALSSGCPAIASDTVAFTVADNCPKQVPVLTAPSGQQSSGDVTFAWNGVPNAAANGLVSYNVHLLLNGADDTVIAQTQGTSFAQKVPPGNHQWYVEATFTSCPALRSTTNSFSVTAPPVCPSSGPTLQSPSANAANVSSPVAFSWSAVSGATSYIVYAGVNGATPTPVGQVTTTSTTVRVDAGNVVWYVEAVVQGCADARSASGAFTIPAPPACPSGPALSEPATGATFTPKANDRSMSFVWTAVPGAKSYTLWVIGVNVDTAGGWDTTATAQTVQLDRPGQYRWFVLATFEGTCPQASSEQRILNVAAPPPCIVAQPALDSPAEAATLNTRLVTLRWEPVSNASLYVVAVYPGTRDAQGNVTYTGVPIVSRTLTAGQTSAVVDIPYGLYKWAVAAHGEAGCTRVDSPAVRVFETKKAIVCNPLAPTLATPSNGAIVTTTSVQFVWNPVTGASAYQLFLVPAGGSPTAIGAPSPALSATAPVPNGNAEWFVRTYFPGCDSIDSPRSRFTVNTCTAKPATLNGPTEGSTGLTSPVSFSFSQVKGATSYDVLVGVNGEEPAPIGNVLDTGTTTSTTLVASVKPGAVTWRVRANVAGCGQILSAPGHFSVVAPPPCTSPDRPTVAAQGQASSGQPFSVNWTPVPNVRGYEIQESTTPAFSNASTRQVSGTTQQFAHSVGLNTIYYYRVRGLSSCNTSAGAYSAIGKTTVLAPPPTPSSISSYMHKPPKIYYTFFIRNVWGRKLLFKVRSDRPWISFYVGRVSSGGSVKVLDEQNAEGELPAEGTTLTVAAETEDLQAGANIGTLDFQLSEAGGTNGGRATPAANEPPLSLSIPVSVNLVTPAAPTGKSTAVGESLIIPAVASAKGANGSAFQTDVRITNVSAEAVRYTLFFAPSGTDGTKSSQSTSIDLAAGQTIALNNLLQNWFAVDPAQNVVGSLEIRPVSSGTDVGTARATIATSRTFNVTSDGTYGQTVPAVPFSRFVGKGQTLTLLQLAQSAAFRTNLGFVEGSGSGARVKVTGFNATGTEVGSFTVDLLPGEQRQIDQALAKNGITGDNLRVNVEVTSDTGRVFAYASVIDNRTNDPLMISGTELATIKTSSIVIPGIADLDTGGARWRSDVRVFNAGTTTVNATATFHPAGNPSATSSIPLSISAGEVKALDDILRSRFNLVSVGGSLHIATTTPSPLLASSRTYSDTGRGTVGQFVAGVPVEDGLAKDAGSAHVLQLEESADFRSNVGVAEVSGKSVTVEITAVIPDSTATPRVTFTLAPYEFKQYPSFFRTLALGTVYNARVSARVLDGDGRIMVYGSVVDNRTADPTYVAGEK